MQVPPPPIVMPAAPAPTSQLVTWVAGAAHCVGGEVTPIRPPDLAPVLGYAAPILSGERRLRFTIAADGRPLDIAPVNPGYMPYGDDLAPALATARFAAVPHGGCTVTFTARATPIGEAPMASIFALASSGGRLAPAVLGRIRAASGDCATLPPPRLRAFPDVDALPRMAGAASWTVTRFDVDARGRPAHPAVAASSGNGALDRAASDAVARSRFAPGVRHGCLWPSGLRAATLAPPPAPTEDELRPADATCPRDLPWATPPTLSFPQAWQRRSIEGWAVVAYDVAPWGAIGNARVLAAEPAAAFGDAALNVVRYATKRTSGSGYTGCVDRVWFRINDEAPPPMNAPPPPPID